MLVDAALNEPLGKHTVMLHGFWDRSFEGLPLKLNRQLGDHRQLYSVQS